MTMSRTERTAADILAPNGPADPAAAWRRRMTRHSPPQEEALLVLNAARKARREAEALRDAALADIAREVGPAREAGLTVAQIMEATGLARQTIYGMLGGQSSV